MYLLVRLNGIISIAFGLILIGLGVTFGILGVTHNLQIVNLINVYLMQGSGYKLLDVRFYSTVLGVLLFLVGLAMASHGQLLISLANTSYNTGEMVKLMQQLITAEKPTVINHVNVNTEDTRTQDKPVVITTEVESGDEKG